MSVTTNAGEHRTITGLPACLGERAGRAAIVRRSSSLSASGITATGRPLSPAASDRRGQLARARGAAQALERKRDRLGGGEAPAAALVGPAAQLGVRVGERAVAGVLGAVERHPLAVALEQVDAVDRDAAGRRQRRHEQQRHVRAPGATTARSASYSSHTCARSVLSPRSTSACPGELRAGRGRARTRPARGPPPARARASS